MDGIPSDLQKIFCNDVTIIFVYTHRIFTIPCSIFLLLKDKAIRLFP